MFRRLHDTNPTLRLSVNGVPILAAPGDTVAAALLLSGCGIFRWAKPSGEPRGPYCGMGVCFDCVVTINGHPGRQACLVPAEDGMVVETTANPKHVGTGSSS
jgi:D-hydroxyproline dehydrogenase subunit gamma